MILARIQEKWMTKRLKVTLTKFELINCLLTPALQPHGWITLETVIKTAIPLHQVGTTIPINWPFYMREIWAVHMTLPWDSMINMGKSGGIVLTSDWNQMLTPQKSLNGHVKGHAYSLCFELIMTLSCSFETSMTQLFIFE